MKRFFLKAILVIGALAEAQELIPHPAQVTPTQGTFHLASQTGVIAGPALKAEGEFLLKELHKHTRVKHRMISPTVARRLQFRGGITLMLNTEFPLGQYELVVDPKNIVISGHDAEAVFHGIQSFLQLIPAERVRGFLPVPCLRIVDAPFPGNTVREVKLDLARHLYPTEDLKNFIDLMAFHKLNRLSLYLSNDQGWRIEIPKFPKLTEVGSLRASTPPYGERYGSDGVEYAGFYTQKNLRELVAHAKSRHVDLIPVIALPGHVSPLLAAYPQWGNDDLERENPRVRADWRSSGYLLAPKQETFAAVEVILGEIATLFDAAEIGIDDDMTALEEWETSPAAQVFIKENQLKNAVGLKQYFREFLIKAAGKLGRKVRFESTLNPALRLDYYQRTAALELADDIKREAVGGLLTLGDVYNSTAEAAVLWTPFMHEWKKVEYMAFPRLAAFAEARWTPKNQRSYQDFLRRLSVLSTHYLKRDVEVADPFQKNVREALHGTKVMTNLGHYLDHWPEALFDGKKETFFWSNRALATDDFVTVMFPEVIFGNVRVSTDGPAADETGGASLANGVLEVSPDGETWEVKGTFIDGVAEVMIPEGTRAIRIRVTDNQEAALIIHEITLSQPLTPMVLNETRSVVIGTNLNGQPVTREVTFVADFSGHPELRQKVAACREQYFKNWYRVASYLGNANRADTPVSFTLQIDPERFGNASRQEVEARFLVDLVSHLQTYQAGTPDWLTTGIQALIRNSEIPDLAPRSLPRKSDAVTGGNASAAFLKWIAEKYGEFSITGVSAASLDGYSPLEWKAKTGLTLEELVSEYQK